MQTPVEMVIYADDNLLWGVDRTKLESTAHSVLQHGFNWTVCYIEEQGLRVTHETTAMFVFSAKARIAHPATVIVAWEGGGACESIQVPGTQHSRSIELASHCTTRIAAYRRLLKTMIQLCCASWKNGQVPLLHLYEGIVMSRMLHALPLIINAGYQWDSFVRLHSVALRFSLGVLLFYKNVTCSLCHLVRMSETTSPTVILKRLLVIERSHLGRLA